MVALEKAGIEVDRYVAYEIDENAIKVSERNYPKIEHCGDVTTADFKQYKGFDLLIGGSPCQALSSSNVWLKDGEYGVCGGGNRDYSGNTLERLKLSIQSISFSRMWLP